jgi:tetratricopeptide (TPR) repeat protein
MDEGGTLFSQTSSQLPLTLPSHVSLLTSTYPFWNGIEDHTQTLSPDSVTLTTVLKSRGYRTAAFVGGFVLDRRFGLGQSLDVYVSPFDVRAAQGIDPSDLKRPGEEVTQAAVQWLEKNSTAPFFVFLYLFDLHTPYGLTPAQRARFGGPGYDAELAYVDDTLGRFWSFLAGNHLPEKALIVFLSDHGESLGEHGEQTHGYFIYESTLRVPLIIHWPGETGSFLARVSEPVSLIDIAPTILQYLGVPRPPEFQGRGLMELFYQKSPIAPREIYSESMNAQNHYGCSSLRSLRVGKYKYIEAPKREFYNLARDPGETNDLYAQQETLALTFRERLLALQTRYGANSQRSPQGVSPEIVERLASLGYVAITSSHPSNSGSNRDPKDRISAYAATHPAIALACAGRLAESASMLENILNRNPDLMDTRNILGMVQQKLGRHKQAARNFEEVLRVDPSNILAHYNAGVNCFELHRLDDARKHMEAILTIASGGERREVRWPCVRKNCWAASGWRRRTTNKPACTSIVYWPSRLAIRLPNTALAG